MHEATTTSMRRPSGSTNIAARCCSRSSTRPTGTNSETSRSARERCFCCLRTLPTTLYALQTRPAWSSSKGGLAMLWTACAGTVKNADIWSKRRPFTAQTWAPRSKTPSSLLRRAAKNAGAKSVARSAKWLPKKPEKQFDDQGPLQSFNQLLTTVVDPLVPSTAWFCRSKQKYLGSRLMKPNIVLLTCRCPRYRPQPRPYS